MTYEKLKELIAKHTDGIESYHAIISAVDAYTEASNGAKPIVSVSLLRSKAKEYAKFIYKEGYSDPIYHPEVMQTMNDFEAGFKAGMRFCNER